MSFPHLPTTTMLLTLVLFATLPSSGSYKLNNYGFGSGGTSNSTSANYSLNATTGETSNVQSTSTNFKARSGNQNTQQAHVPDVPTFTNAASYYNKLKFIVIPGANASDTKFSIAISSDNFVTTQYIKIDDTVTGTKSFTDYQTYAAWGGASGQFVVGLTPSTTYKIKVSAMQGNFTETEYGPTASAATVAPSITFDIDTSAIDTETAAPYSVSFANLYPGTVVGSTEKIWIDLNTNAESGAGVFISSLNAGLRSTRLSFTLSSATADLASASSGYGAQGQSVTQTSGGPLALSSPYNGAGQNVGILDATIRQLLSATSPITAGRASIQIKAKASISTPSSADYNDTLTITTAGIF
jgi:hypothetical protein